MIWSRYNLLFEKEKTKFIYNSYSNFFAILDEKTFLDISNVKNYKFENISNNLIEDLKKYKVIVESDEYAIWDMKQSVYFMRNDRSVLGLTIAPTLDCNYKCSYCYEINHPKLYMDVVTEKNLIKFIENQNFKKLHIIWYGGEPLMAWETIKRVSEELNRKKIDYYSEIVTNAYLLTDEKIRLFKELEINELQITIDGMQEIHDKRRYLKNNKGTFNKIINNLDALIKYENFPFVNIRVNIDKSNFEQFVYVKEYIDNRYSNNKFCVYPGYLTDYHTDRCNTLTSCVLSKEAITDFKISMYLQHNINLNFYPSDFRFECAARNINNFVIGPQGEMYKCWEHIGNENCVFGNINSENIVFDKNKLNKFLIAADPFDDSDCLSCFYLPICSGGCPNLRIGKKYNNKGVDYCSQFKVRFQDFLKLHYLSKIEKLENEV